MSLWEIMKESILHYTSYVLAEPFTVILHYLISSVKWGLMVSRLVSGER
jgi:hypothetical protein